MATLIRVTTTKPLPKDAKLVTRKGQRCVQMKRRGRPVAFVLTECGTKYRHESAKWYVQYKDENDEWQRQPGFTDKDATLQLAADLEKRVERRKAGLSDPELEQQALPLLSHLDDFEDFLKAKENTDKHVQQTCNRVRRMLDGCKFVLWRDVNPDAVVRWLAQQRNAGNMGIKTSNYYLASLKEFMEWMIPNRAKQNPLAGTKGLNTETDIRWERRPLSADAFARLVAAASVGPSIQCVEGRDRAMLYILAAWTGYRRGELATLTLKSFNFSSSPPSVEVDAAYSKRRKKDAVPLHPDVAELVKVWLASSEDTDNTTPLFALKTAGGGFRRTAKMMKLDLQAARDAWIGEARSDEERGGGTRTPDTRIMIPLL